MSWPGALIKTDRALWIQSHLVIHHDTVQKQTWHQNRIIMHQYLMTAGAIPDQYGIHQFQAVIDDLQHRECTGMIVGRVQTVPITRNEARCPVFIADGIQQVPCFIKQSHTGTIGEISHTGNAIRPSCYIFWILNLRKQFYIPQNSIFQHKGIDSLCTGTCIRARIAFSFHASIIALTQAL